MPEEFLEESNDNERMPPKDFIAFVGEKFTEADWNRVELFLDYIEHKSTGKQRRLSSEQIIHINRYLNDKRVDNDLVLDDETIEIKYVKSSRESFCKSVYAIYPQYRKYVPQTYVKNKFNDRLGIEFNKIMRLRESFTELASQEHWKLSPNYALLIKCIVEFKPFDEAVLETLINIDFIKSREDLLPAAQSALGSLRTLYFDTIRLFVEGDKDFDDVEKGVPLLQISDWILHLNTIYVKNNKSKPLDIPLLRAISGGIQADKFILSMFDLIFEYYPMSAESYTFWQTKHGMLSTINRLGKFAIPLREPEEFHKYIKTTLKSSEIHLPQSIKAIRDTILSWVDKKILAENISTLNHFSPELIQRDISKISTLLRNLILFHYETIIYNIDWRSFSIKKILEKIEYDRRVDYLMILNDCIAVMNDN